VTTARRQIVRPAPLPVPHPQADRQMQKLRSRLEAERSALTRWMRKLKRAFHSVEKLQLRICRLERQLAQREQ
jgi:hypothetical protein